MANDTSSAFYRLSEELLTMIAEESFNFEYPDDEDDPVFYPRERDQIMDLLKTCRLSQLKSLRESHPRFAYLTRVEKELFSTIHCTPDIKLPDASALESVGPFVRRVVFRPAAFFPETAGNNPRRPASKKTMKTRIKLGERALAALTRRLEAGWALPFTQALRKLPNLQTVVIASPYPHQHIDEYSLPEDLDFNECYCNKFASCVQSGEDLFSLFLRSSSEAKARFSELSIEHEDTLRCWTRMLHWQTLDLSKLTKLNLCWKGNRWPYTIEIQPCVKQSEPDTSFAAMLTKCSATLEELRIDCEALCLWADDLKITPPELHQLRSLDVSNSIIDPHMLGGWILDSPKLEQFALTDTSSRPWGEWDVWRPLFQAIREHPARMNVRLLRFMDHELPWAKLYVNHDTSKVLHSEDFILDNANAKVAFSLKNFMAGSTKWDLIDTIM